MIQREKGCAITFQIDRKAKEIILLGGTGEINRQRYLGIRKKNGLSETEG